MQTQVLKIETPKQFHAAVEQAAEVLARGEVAAVPTETVYGLAGNALNEAAVRKIYVAKGRPIVNPIIVHIDSLAMAGRYSREWPESASLLARAFWPGPLTLVLPKSEAIPGIVTAGGSTVALRWPAHPFMRELIHTCGFPIAAPSANLSNELSPTTGEHVLRMLRGRIPLIVDAGPSSVGIESTVVDLTASPPRVLRAGMISSKQIGQVLHVEVREAPAGAENAPLKSPGLLRRHYAPRARLLVQKWNTEAELADLVRQTGVAPSQVNIIAHESIPQANPYGRVAIIPHDPEAYARALYAELHRCDELGAALILAEAVPAGEEWQGIRDRLNRASAEH